MSPAARFADGLFSVPVNGGVGVGQAAHADCRVPRMADFRRVEARLNRETFSEMSVEEQAVQFPTKGCVYTDPVTDGLFSLLVKGGVSIGSALQAVCGTHSLCSPQS